MTPIENAAYKAANLKRKANKAAVAVAGAGDEEFESKRTRAASAPLPLQALEDQPADQADGRFLPIDQRIGGSVPSQTQEAD